MSPPLLPSILQPLTHPPLSLLLPPFLLSKLLLLLIALLAPTPAYDTSTSLLYSSHPPLPPPPWYISKLVRWDAIYYTAIARRGYVFEQDWAFAWGFTRALAGFASALGAAGVVHPAYASALAGVLLANVAHFGGALVLYRVSGRVLPLLGVGLGEEAAGVVAVLFVVAPAGVMLVAPYAEAGFAGLGFWGWGLYGESVLEGGGGWKVVGAGAVLGVAAMVRGNGVLGGLVFAVDAVERVWDLPWGGRRWKAEEWRGLGATVLAGGLVGAGFVLPQGVAWWEFCAGGGVGEERREWCGYWVPSIYAWVQSHYWNVGFLRYWTVSNLPLFVLAAPMLSIMVASAIWGLGLGLGLGLSGGSTGVGSGDEKSEMERLKQRDRARRVVLRLAIPQLVLAVMALTTYHVQIITRLSSGYPVWYWWVAWMMSENREVVVFGKKWQLAKVISRWMVVYAIVHAGLFVSFLPPA